MRALILCSAAVLPAVFTELTAWAASAGDVPGTLAAGLPAALGWTAWAFLAALVIPRPRRKRARWSRKDAAELKELLDAPPKRGRR